MTGSTGPLAVLVVEDEALLVMDLEAMIEDCGHRMIADAASLHDVADLPLTPQPDLAFVDIQLARGTSGIDVSEMIRQRWPDTFIVFVTANPRLIQPDFGEAQGVIPKPFSRNGLLAAMQYIEQCVCTPPPAAPLPSSFVPAPTLDTRWA